MASEVELCNRALLRIGHTRLLSSLAEKSVEAQLCAQLYPEARDLVLAAFPWPHAKRRVALAPLSGVTRTDWANVFTLPSDCLAARYVVVPGCRNPAAEDRQPFEVEANDAGDGQVLLCDLDAPELVYTAALTDPTRWPPTFCTALVTALAAQLALAIRKDTALARVLQGFADALVARGGAQAANARQADPDPEPNFLTARR